MNINKLQNKIKEKGHTSLKLSEINWLIDQVKKLERIKMELEKEKRR